MRRGRRCDLVKISGASLLTIYEPNRWLITVSDLIS